MTIKININGFDLLLQKEEKHKYTHTQIKNKKEKVKYNKMKKHVL